MFAASKSGKPAAAGATTDPNFNSTVALLETTGTNGQQNNTFLDSSTNAITVTRTSAPTQGTFTPFSQTGWSGYFDGTTDYLTVPSTTAFAFGSSVDFTLECWVYLNSYSAGGIASGMLIGTINGSKSGWGIQSGDTISSLRLTSNASGTWADNLACGTNNGIPLNTWTHIAVVRYGDSLSIYRNGI